MKKTTKIFGLLLTLFGLALVTGCTPITDTPEVPEETTYTVTIASGITNGTVSTDKTSAKAGETVKLTVTPKEGYKLENLIIVDSSTNSIPTTSNTFTMPESNVTVDATFTAKIKHTVTFDSKGGSEITSKIITHGDKITRPADPTKKSIDSETYTFDNWYTSDDNGKTLSETAFNFDTPITSDITLYAKWAVNAVTHEVKFVSDGNTLDTKTVIYGNKVEKPADPTKAEIDTERYSFAYWYTSDKPELAFDFNTEIKADITLYAKWNTIALYSITIASSTNGTVSASKISKITAGETITLTVTPETGYELGEITVNGAKITGNTFEMPAGNATVSATFKLITYKVTYAAYIENGVVILPESIAYVEHGTNAQISKEVDIPGYEKIAYVRYSGTIVNKNIELKPELWFKAGASIKFSDDYGNVTVMLDDAFNSWKEYFNKDNTTLSKNISKSEFKYILSGNPLLMKYCKRNNNSKLYLGTLDEFDLSQNIAIIGEFKLNTISYTASDITCKCDYKSYASRILK